MNRRLCAIASAHAGRPVVSDLDALHVEAEHFEKLARTCILDKWLGSREIASARADLARFHAERALPRISLGGAS